MIVYGIARPTNVVAGHGDSYTSIVIERMGAYNSGNFPPIFVSKEKAETYLATMDKWMEFRIVELELVVE